MQWLYAATLFISAVMLFVVEPMFAKMVLPSLGGTPAVWNTCMMFYQAALLAGYVYAHLSIRWLGARRQAVFHLALLALPWLVLPIGVAGMGDPPVDSNPIPWLLALMAVSVGLPFFVVSASAPMLQAWFAQTGHPAAKDPYFLYAASNLGSMVGLVGYPLLVEPALPLSGQSAAWAAGYGLLTALTVGCAALLWLRPRGPDSTQTGREARPTGEGGQSHFRGVRRENRNSPQVDWRLRARWLLLSLVPSSLLLGVTAHIATDIAAVPLLWVVPLALYLLTFVLVFARHQVLRHVWMVRLQVPLVLLMAVLFFHELLMLLPAVWISMHLLTFFVTAMVCHGDLAESRPEVARLTEFYVCISVGGVLGGAFNALVAPMLFPWTVEYPLALVAACLLRPQTGRETDWRDLVLPAAVLAAVGGFLLSAELAGYYVSPGLRGLALLAAGGVVAFWSSRPLRFGLGVGAMLLVGGMEFGTADSTLYSERNFFGVVRVVYQPFPPAHVMRHGSTNHGTQRLDPAKRRDPLSYFHRTGPLGQIFRAVDEMGRVREIGITGLGTGTIASYGKSGQRFTYYEIDPAVERVARDRDYFTYLSDCRAEVDIVLGDARLNLAKEPDGRFDLLILDAFSSDSLPVHLVTREAVELYLRKTADNGILAFNLSNRYLNIEPVLGNIAKSLGLACKVNHDIQVPREERIEGKSPSEWLVMARKPENLGNLQEDPNWLDVPADPSEPIWTDDFSNIISVMRWSGSAERKP